MTPAGPCCIMLYWAAICKTQRQPKHRGQKAELLFFRPCAVLFQFNRVGNGADGFGGVGRDSAETGAFHIFTLKGCVNGSLAALVESAVFFYSFRLAGRQNRLATQRIGTKNDFPVAEAVGRNFEGVANFYYVRNGRLKYTAPKYAVERRVRQTHGLRKRFDGSETLDNQIFQINFN